MRNNGSMPVLRTTPPPLVHADERGTIDDLAALCHGGSAVLTGAGISTASGIPDYRGVTGRQHRANPMSHRDFVTDPDRRRRYWARSMVGWATFGTTEPNPAHRAVADLQHAGHLGTVITQNVDGLHQAAGATDVVELHGTLSVVACLDCDLEVDRAWLQSELAAANPHWVGRTATTTADGDAQVDEAGDFRVVACPRCDGVLMPQVVFFGAGVPGDTVSRCYRIVEQAPALVVLGTSLHVWSGLRFVRHAARHGRPVAIVNHGTTRADDLATVRLDEDLCEVLPTVAELLPGR